MRKILPLMSLNRTNFLNLAVFKETIKFKLTLIKHNFLAYKGEKEDEESSFWSNADAVVSRLFDSNVFCSIG
jgi:hypothetical protein